MNSAEYGSLPFDEAIRFFRQKLNLPTEAWTDLWEGMHARAFVIAGATRSDLLADLRAVVDGAIADGTTLEEFRKGFGAVIARRGWPFRDDDTPGYRAWRTGVIYRTNLRTAYATGEFEQLTDPDMLAARPYWRYRHGGSASPRPDHLLWDGLTLRADDSWWDTHFPPNGWNCSCFVDAISDADLTRLGKSQPDTAPPDTFYEWTNPQTGEVLSVPKGIDPGWAYNPGRVAHGGRGLGKMREVGQNEGRWESLSTTNWQSYARPRDVPMDEARASLASPITDADLRGRSAAAVFQDAIERVLGGAEQVFTFEQGGFRFDVRVDAARLAQHLAENRSKWDRLRFVPLMSELMEDPYEVWAGFERNRETGLVALRVRIIKGVRAGKDRLVWLISDVYKGQMEAWTFYTIDNERRFNATREGRLLWARDRDT